MCQVINPKFYRLANAVDELSNMGSFSTKNTEFAKQLGEVLVVLNIEHDYMEAPINNEFSNCNCTSEYIFTLKPMKK